MKHKIFQAIQIVNLITAITLISFRDSLAQKLNIQENVITQPNNKNKLEIQENVTNHSYKPIRKKIKIKKKKNQYKIDLS